MGEGNVKTAPRKRGSRVLTYESEWERVAPPQAEAGEGTGGTRFIASLIPSATTERGLPDSWPALDITQTRMSALPQV